MQFDISLMDHDGHEVASYGPRYLNTSGGGSSCVEECAPEHAQFWGVYMRKPDYEASPGEVVYLAECVGDAVDSESAKAFAHALFELRSGYRHADHPAFHNPALSY